MFRMLGQDRPIDDEAPGRFTWLSSVSQKAALDILAKKNSGEQRHVLSQNLAEDEVS